MKFQRIVYCLAIPLLLTGFAFQMKECLQKYFAGQTAK